MMNPILNDTDRQQLGINYDPPISLYKMAGNPRNLETAWSTPPGYEAIAEIPSMPPRRVTMLKALHSGNGSLLPLMECLYNIAEKDLSQMPAKDSRSVRDSMNKIVQDRDTGNLVAFDLLKSMSLETIEACILNTMGARMLLDPAFKEKVYKIATTYSIYINTAVHNRPSRRFLNSNDYDRLGQMILNYAQSKGIQGDQQAVAIDCAFWNTAIQRGNSRQGERRFISGSNKTKTLRNNFKQLRRRDLDFEGRIERTQSPMEVGFSTNLSNRTKDHGLDSNLRRSTPPWALTLSCLRAMGKDLKSFALVCYKSGSKSNERSERS
jgi:hypothetical protein